MTAKVKVKFMEPCVKGKISELQVVSELLKKGFEMYVPVVDICVDCIVKSQKDGKPATYYELQIKRVKRNNVSIRGGRKILEYIKKNKPENYFLVFNLFNVDPTSKLDILFLRHDQIEKYAHPRGIDEFTIRLPSKDVQDLREQNFEKLVEIMSR